MAAKHVHPQPCDHLTLSKHHNIKRRGQQMRVSAALTWWLGDERGQAIFSSGRRWRWRGSGGEGEGRGGAESSVMVVGLLAVVSCNASQIALLSSGSGKWRRCITVWGGRELITAHTVHLGLRLLCASIMVFTALKKQTSEEWGNRNSLIYLVNFRPAAWFRYI